MMDVLFTSLVEYLDLESAYNIFVMNPKRDARRGKYGYRRGLSENEISFLKEDKSLQDKILRSESPTENAFETAIWSAMDKIKKPLYQKHPMAKFSWTITEETDLVEWYDSCLNALNNVERLSQKKDAADIIQAKVVQDWLWSMGSSPLSITSQGWHISQFLSDTIARSYMLTTLEESIQQVNSAIHRLMVERTCILHLR